MPSGAGKFSVHLGMAEVPDPRLQALAAIFQPRKVTPAQIEFVDLAGIVKGEAKDSTYLAQLRNVDALAHVVRAFRDPTVLHMEGEIGPARDIEVFEMELILADLALIEGRQERVSRDIKKMRSPELEREAALLERMRPWLEEGKPLRELALTADEEKVIRGFTLLSQKPMLLVLNMDEQDTHRQQQLIDELSLGNYLSRPRTALVQVCAKIEAEIAELGAEEAQVFLSDLGFSEPGLDRLLQRQYALLELISFLTAGEPEVRAWPVPSGCTAVKAAGTIHTDFEKGFIRAEVIPWQQLVECGSFAHGRERGWLRSEGRDYTVQDGDVITFRFNV
jgi:ribosome-binding ATPase